MKIKSVAANNRKKLFEVELTSRSRMPFPYSKAEPAPTKDDLVASVAIDKELGREGFEYFLVSGRTGVVLADQVLDYNQDPAYMRNMLLHRMTVEAQERVAASPLSKREIVRRLGTSATQLYRLLDSTNYNKTVDQLIKLLQVLDCDVDLVVRAKSA